MSIGLIFCYALFGLVLAYRIWTEVVTAAKQMHLYGELIPARVALKHPILTSFFGFARVEPVVGPPAVAKRLWCFGMPADFRGVRIGDTVMVMREARLRRGRGRAWLPFWQEVHPDAATAEPPDTVLQGGPALLAERVMLNRIASVLLPLEQEMPRRERQENLLGAGSMAFLICLLALSGRAGLVLLAGFAASYLMIWVVHRLGRPSRRAAIIAAVGRFRAEFPEGSQGRQAAMMILSEDPKATRGWQELYGALTGTRVR
jgi:hypothetical protein